MQNTLMGLTVTAVQSPAHESLWHSEPSALNFLPMFTSRVQPSAHASLSFFYDFLLWQNRSGILTSRVTTVGQGVTGGFGVPTGLC